MDTPGAGPSRPRQPSKASAPTAAEPTTPRSRRRSWFHFGSSTSSTPPPPLPLRGSSISGDDGEELELGLMTPRQSKDSGRAPVPELGPGEDTELGKGEEMLTIDGDLEDVQHQRTLVKKKKKRRSKGDRDEDGGEVVRMMDLKPPRRPSNSSDASGRTEVPRERAGEYGQAFGQRTFSRTASDRVTYGLEHGPSTDLVKPPPRTSSIPFNPPPQFPRTPSASSNKDQPLLPSDRPLPPLPPERATTPPTAPTGIYVTPSSPTKDTHQQEYQDDSTSLGAQVERIFPQRERERRSSSNDSVGRRPSTNQLRSSSPIGLGLPTHRSLGLGPSDIPPPVPSKRQSVSSPVPTRSSSPAQKISFVEPQEVIADSRGRSETAHIDEKRQKVRRARSLSGIFKSSPVIPPSSPAPSRSPTPEPKEEPSKSTGGGGVLEWLGVRKTVKRRQSETHLRQKEHSDPTPPPAQATRIPSPHPRVSIDSHTTSKKGKSPHGSFGDLTSLRNSHDSARGNQVSSRPSSRNSNTGSKPAVTAIPASISTSSSKLGSLFSRRQASKRSEGISPSPPASLPSNQGISPRDSGVASSRSSFSLPPFDPVVSPIYPNSGPWMSSPGAETDTEEMLFSPEGGSNWGPGIRPWMDGTEQQQSQRSTRSSFSSPPLGSLPEQTSPPNTAGEKGLSPKATPEGRMRSHSDAPQPSAVPIQGTRPQSRGGSSIQSSSPGPRMSASLASSPVLPGRPKLGNRANSGNAAIIDRMKTVFARSSSRQRASTLLPESKSQSRNFYTDEFGQLRTSSEFTSNASSISGTGGSNSPKPIQTLSSADDPSQPQHSILGLQDAERRRERLSNEADESNRSSIASSSQGAPSSRMPSNEIRREGSFMSRARPRASTVSVGPTTQAFVPALEAPIVYPAAATPPRRRPSAIRKLSNTLLGTASKSSNSSPNKSASLFPLPPRSTGSISSGLSTSGFQWDESTPGLTSVSPRPSMGSFTGPSASISTSSTSTSVPAPIINIKQLAARVPDESVEDYVRRISLSIPRNEIAGVLATSNDEFYTEALRLYMTRFEFRHQPLDVALRQLLMHMSLPKETQQIDRVVEAFSVRYEQCEPDLFRHKDNTYVVAFSMMMLHTDAFNRHNKNKMSKSDYVRNTRLDGVSPLVLEAFYDNITFSPFVFIEQDADLLPAASQAANTDGASPMSMPPPRSGKVDVYHMIVNKLLHTLRLHIERQIPADSPYSAFGTMATLDIDSLHLAFSKAPLIRVMLPGKRKTSTGILSSTPTRGAPPVEVVLKIVKVAALSRMDDSLDSSAKKSNRKWKPWSVVLTGSQIMFVKDGVMASTIADRIERSKASTSAGVDNSVLLPAIPLFKPDEVISLKDCIAVYDRISARPSAGVGVAPGIVQAQTLTFRLVMPHGRQYLLATNDEGELNSWIAHVNYASAFKTAGLRMRGTSMNKEQVVLAGAAAAASHKRDMQVQEHAHIGSSRDAQTPNIEITTPKKTIFGDSRVIASVGARSSSYSYTDTSPVLSKSSTEAARIDTNVGGVEVDLDGGGDEGEQLEEVFDVVKAELAAGRGPDSGRQQQKQRQKQGRPPSSATSEKSAASGFGMGTSFGAASRPSSSIARSITGEDQLVEDDKTSAQDSRAVVCRAQLSRLTAKRTEISDQLAASLIIARNLAILTPFQKTTRDRLSSSIPSLATQIRTDRIQLLKYETYISILERDMDKEQQDWATVRHVALQAAARSLRDPKGVKAIVDDVNQPITRTGLPKLSLPDMDHRDGDVKLMSGSSLAPSPIWSPSPSPSPSSPHRHRDHDIFSAHGSGGRPSDSRMQQSPGPGTAAILQHDPSLRTAPRRSSSSLSTDRQPERRSPHTGNGSGSGTTTGRSTPMMFSLSESEDLDQEARKDQGVAVEKTMIRGGTVKAKDTTSGKGYSSMRRSGSGSRRATKSTINGTRGAGKKKREREITAVYVGPDSVSGPEVEGNEQRL